MTEVTKTRRPRRFARTPKAGDPAAGQVKDTSPDASPAPAPPEGTKPKSGSKISQVIALLRRSEGATLAEMVEATGWQPHTTRAALTGLKKKGHAIERTKRDDATCYHIAGEA